MARTKAALGAGARLADYLSASLMARVVPPAIVHEVLDARGRNSRRIRAFPAVAGVHYVMALSLYPEASYEAVFSAVSQGLAWEVGAPQPAGVSKVAISLLRSRIGAQPLADLVRRCCQPLVSLGGDGRGRSRRRCPVRGGGGLSALGAALFSIGIPKDSVIEYEQAVKTAGFLVVAHGSPDEMARSKVVLEASNPTRIDLHENVKAPAADASSTGHAGHDPKLRHDLAA